MKCCYVDESGHASDYIVVVGVVVYATRIRPTKADWKPKSTFGAVSRPALSSARDKFDFGGLLHASDWSNAAFRLVNGIHKQYQRVKQNKGNTLFVCGNACKGDDLVSFALNPPVQTEEFYNRPKKQLPLNQVIDVPYFADSYHVGLIKVANLLAFLLRLCAELNAGITTEKYHGEIEQVRE